MSYNALTTTETTAGKPGKQSLFRKIKDNFDYLYSLVMSQSAGAGVPNGSFEIDSDSDGVPDNWTQSLYSGGAGAIETTSPAHGAQAYKFTHPGGAGNGGGSLTSGYLEISPNLDYVLRYITWASAAGMKNIVRITYYTAAKVEISSEDLYTSTSNPTTATGYTSRLTVPATARYLKIILIGGYTDTDVAGSAYFDGIDIDDAITQGALKTSSGSVSISDGPWNGTDTRSESAHLTLPGGAYGFQPQFKQAAGGSSPVWVSKTMTARHVEAEDIGSTYLTRIYLRQDCETSSGSDMTLASYAQQTYVTSSGEVYWIFALRDRETGALAAVYQAPDHPCFGNGGDPEAVPHPFGAYNTDRYELIVVNPDEKTLREMTQRTGNARDLAEVIRKEYEIDDEAEAAWPDKEITVGLPTGVDWRFMPAGGPVRAKKRIIPRPDGVSVKKIKKKREKSYKR